MKISEIKETVSVKTYTFTETELNEYVHKLLNDSVESALKRGIKKGYDKGFLIGRADFRDELVDLYNSFELQMNIAGCVELCNRLVNKIKYFTK